MSFHYPINGGGGGGGVTDLNGLTGAVTLSAGNNITLNESGNDIEVTANFTQEGKYMISGGATWSGTGLTYDVSFLTYFFNGLKTANPTQVTLDASDPTNNRFDAIVVDEAGTVTAITGTPSANTEVPAIPEDQLQVTIILVAAGSTTPTIASEEIYMDDPTTNWTFSTYQTATPTGSINFAGTSSPKQGTECIEASTDARLGARFVRATSFDAFQYTMLQVWVRFTGTAVATNKSLNVRFENSAGTLVANTVNLFSYGLQRGVLNTWQLVVVPITAFGALPATVKGLKMIMAGGTVGVVRQWDIDYMILTNGSVPYANVPTIAFYKDNVGIASQSGLNIIQGLGGTTITGVNNPTLQTVDYTLNAFGGDTLSYRDETTKESIIKRTFDSTVSNTVLEIPVTFFAESYTGTFSPGDLVETRFGESTGTLLDVEVITVPNQTSFTNQTYTGTWSGGVTPQGDYTGSYGTYAYNLEITDTAAEEWYVTSVTGTFTPGETVTGGTSGETAIVITQVVDGDTYLYVKSASGPFTLGETITGGTSGQTAVYQTLNTTTDIFTMTAPGGTIVGAISRANQFRIDGISVGVDSYTGTLGDEFDFDTVFGDQNINMFYITGFSGSLSFGETRLNNLTVTGNTDNGQLNALQSLITTGAAVTTFDLTTQTQTSTGTIGAITGDDYVYNVTSGTPQPNDFMFVIGIEGAAFFVRSVTSGPVTTTITTGYVTLDDIGQSLPGSGILATSGSDKVFAGVYDATSIGGTNKSFGVVSTINSVDSAYFFPVADGTAGQGLVTDGAGNVSFQDLSIITKSVKITVPSADLLAVVNAVTPYELIPAPGSGKFIDVISVSCFLNFNTTPYDFNGNLSIGTSTSIGTYSGKDGGEITVSPYDAINVTSNQLSVISGKIGNREQNNPLFLHKGAATTVTQGDSDIDLYITYNIVTL